MKTLMNFFRPMLRVVLLFLASQLFSTVQAADAVKELLDLRGDIQKHLVPQFGAGDQVSAAVSKDAAAPGLTITIRPGKADYPGIALKPQGKAWDLSAYGHIEARVVNTGSKRAGFALRVDNAGDWQDSPWNSEQISLEPGQRGTVKVIFGHSYGQQPGFNLNPKEVVQILMFTGKIDSLTTYRVESIVAAGPAGEKPPVDPASVRVKPSGGILLGPGATLDAKSQLESSGAIVAATADGQSLAVILPADNGEQSVALKPAIGRWNLCDATEVRVTLTNDGRTPVLPSVQVISNGGATDVAKTAAPLAAGETAKIVASFIPAVPGKGAAVPKAGYYGNLPGTGTSFGSDAVAAVKIMVKHAGEGKLRIESITAAAPRQSCRRGWESGRP